MKKIFAKLHLWLSIPFGIVISLLCLTGALLVFESELKELTQPELYKASRSAQQPLSFAELIKRVETQVDTISISSVQISHSRKNNYRLGIEGQRRASLLVDPHTGEVKGLVQPYAKGEFFSFVRRLHRWFLFEMKREGICWGKMITGVSTLIFVFILISGIVLWIPKTWKGVKKRLSVKTGAGRFRFWYDFHLAGGKSVALLLLVMALTGLTWSFNWYRNGFYQAFGVELTTEEPKQVSGQNITRSSDSHSTNKKEASSRSSGSESHQITRNPQNALPKGKEGESGGRGKENTIATDDQGGGRSNLDRKHHSSTRNATDYCIWERALGTVSEKYPTYRSITVQDGKISVAAKSFGNTRASDVYTFDTVTGEISDVKLYRDEPKSSKIRGWIYSVHVGSWGGDTTRILYFIACMIGAALPLTGYYIWIKKRWKKFRKQGKANKP